MNFDQSISRSARQMTAPFEVFQNYEFNYNKPNQLQ